jgi:hypothetical protein
MYRVGQILPPSNPEKRKGNWALDYPALIINI